MASPISGKGKGLAEKPESKQSAPVRCMTEALLSTCLYNLNHVLFNL